MSVKNKNNILLTHDEDILLESDLSDGALGTIFGPVKANLQKFGTILQDSAKLIGGDLGYLVKLTFGRLKSLNDLKEMKNDNNRRRKDLLSSISKNSDDLMDSWPDGKITSMMISPGLFFTTAGLSGMGKITSKEFREEVGTYGLNQVPILSKLFGANEDNQYQIMKDISRCEPGDAECMDIAWKRFSGTGTGKDRAPSGLSALALKINSIFLFAHYDVEGPLMFEGEEESKSIPELTPEQYASYASELKNIIDEELKEERSKWIEGQNVYFEKIVTEASNVITLNAKLASTNNSKEFFSVLEQLKKSAGDEMKDLNIENIKSTFKETSNKLRDDEDSMSKIKKSFEEEKVEATEENLASKLEEIVLSSFKGSFLQELKGALTDYYEEVYTIITGGLSTDQRKLIAKDPMAKEYLSVIDSHEKKLKEALSNLKQP